MLLFWFYRNQFSDPKRQLFSLSLKAIFVLYIIISLTIYCYFIFTPLSGE